MSAIICALPFSLHSCSNTASSKLPADREQDKTNQVAMDFFMGLKGKDFIVVCSDTVASQSIIRMKADEEKMVPIDEHKLFVMSGMCRFPLL